MSWISTNFAKTEFVLIKSKCYMLIMFIGVSGDNCLRVNSSCKSWGRFQQWLLVVNTTNTYRKIHFNWIVMFAKCRIYNILTYCCRYIMFVICKHLLSLFIVDTHLHTPKWTFIISVSIFLWQLIVSILMQFLNVYIK